MSDNTGPADLTLRGLVHDLNNVFETISEAAELMSSDPQWAIHAETIQRNVERGRRIVGSIAGQKRAGAELEVVIDRAATFLQDFLKHMPGVKVRIQRRIPAGTRINGEPGDWERVFMNLFLNAAQAMKETGGGEVEVSAAVSEESVHIRIQDNGPGIPETILPKIFKPSFSTRSRQSGMGLHIVHSLVVENRGTVTAENRKEPSGAVFLLTAPIDTTA